MVNNEFKSERVRLINSDGKGLQEMTLREAMEIASKDDLDVICVNSKDEIPVVKIGDYGKFLYEKQKKEKDNKKKAKLNQQDTKEVHISDVIAEHDLAIKAKTVDRLLRGGDKVRLVIRYKGRSLRFINEGPTKLQVLESKVTEGHKIESVPKIEGNRVTMVISPLSSKNSSKRG